jgi:hypothetical protein
MALMRWPTPFALPSLVLPQRTVRIHHLLRFVEGGVSEASLTRPA